MDCQVTEVYDRNCQVTEMYTRDCPVAEVYAGNYPVKEVYAMDCQVAKVYAGNCQEKDVYDGTFESMQIRVHAAQSPCGPESKEIRVHADRESAMQTRSQSCSQEVSHAVRKPCSQEAMQTGSQLCRQEAMQTRSYADKKPCSQKAMQTGSLQCRLEVGQGIKKSAAQQSAMATALALLYDSIGSVGDPTAMGWGMMENMDLQERPIHLYEEYARWRSTPGGAAWWRCCWTPRVTCRSLPNIWPSLSQPPL
jgi:hypothetical protein